MYKPFSLKYKTDGSRLNRNKSCMQIGQLWELLQLLFWCGWRTGDSTLSRWLCHWWVPCPDDWQCHWWVPCSLHLVPMTVSRMGPLPSCLWCGGNTGDRHLVLMAASLMGPWDSLAGAFLLIRSTLPDVMGWDSLFRTKKGERREGSTHRT